MMSANSFDRPRYAGSRRQFLTSSVLGMGALWGSPLFLQGRAHAAEQASQKIPHATGDRMAASVGFDVYQSKQARRAGCATWACVDLGESKPIDAVILYPSNNYLSPGDGFPLRFRIECSDSREFEKAHMIADFSHADFPHPHDNIIGFDCPATRARYVKLSVLQMRPKTVPAILASIPQPTRGEFEAILNYWQFALSKIEVRSRGRDVAVSKAVYVDPEYGNARSAQLLTRPPRPQGETVITNNPSRMTSQASWKPVPFRAHVPEGSVGLTEGVFRTVMEGNITYLLSSYSVDDLLVDFKARAGKPHGPPPSTPFASFWITNLAGSNAGRFLMGAGNTLRWIDHSELRQRLNSVVDGIGECAEPDGYIMAYPKDTFFVSERGAYTRAWLTQGLLDASTAGNNKSLSLLRGYYDWFNKMADLPMALRACIQGGQGMIANTRVYHSPIGRADDVHTIQRFFQENYFLTDLRARNAAVIWNYPYDRPHAYLLTNVLAYLDLYRATGDEAYLEGVLGAWELFHENWQNAGGSISIIEEIPCPPKSNFLYEKLGETCGSAFWISLNHNLHLLFPDTEKYVSEIERSLYNVIIANHAGKNGVRYHTLLTGRKDITTTNNTCCEGQATRTVGSLPAYIYSTTSDGILINLFGSSSLKIENPYPLALKMETRFPYGNEVSIRIDAAPPNKLKLKIRTPSWSRAPIPIHVNGQSVRLGQPGSYAEIERVWQPGDLVTFTLPAGLRFEKYRGADQVASRERGSVYFGPVLMAAVGAADSEIELMGLEDPSKIVQALNPVKGKPLHFRSAFDMDGSGPEFVPYFEVGDEQFSCVPVISAKPPVF